MLSHDPQNPQNTLGKMDIQAIHDGNTYHIDVAITDPQSTNETDLRNAANIDGHAAHMADKKRKQYKYKTTHNLIPFILEAGGRWGMIAKNGSNH